MATALLDRLTGLGIEFIDFIPSLVLALVILAVGYIIGRILGRVTNEVVTRLKLDKRISTSAHLRLRIAHLSDLVVRWVIYLVFIQQASEVLGVLVISQFVNSVIGVLPELIGAGVVVLVAYVVGVYFKDHVVSSHTMYSDLAGKTIFFLILYLGLSVALNVINVPLRIVDNILLILVASIGIGIALALGLGLKDVIREVSKGYVSKHGKTTKRKK